MNKTFSRHWNSVGGFSVTQLMVSCLIFGIIVIATIFALKSGSDARKISTLQTDLSRLSMTIREQLQKDLSNAIRNTGSTEYSFPGINRLGTTGYNQPRASGETNDALVIFAQKFSGMSIPVTMDLPAPPGSPAFLFTNSDSSNDIQRYFSKSADLDDLFILNSIEAATVVKKASVSEINGQKKVMLASADDMTSSDLQRYKNIATQVRTVEVVVYKLDSGKLVRETRRSLPASLEDETGVITRQVLSGNSDEFTIDKFQIDYAFFNRRMGVNLSMPTERLTHVYDAAYSDICSQNGQTCVTFGDLKDARFSIKISKPTSLQSNTFPAESAFQIADGAIRYDAVFTLSPQGLDFGTNDLLGDNANCPVGQIESRCKPECAGSNGPFNNPNLDNQGWYIINGTQVVVSGQRPANYQAYGDLNSDYCKCGTVNNVFKDFELDPGHVPSWTYPDSNPGNANINACLRWYGGCAVQGYYTQLQIKHPAALLACQCLQPTPFEHPFQPGGSDPIYGTNYPSSATNPFLVQDPSTLLWTNLMAGMSDITAGVGGITNPYRCSMWDYCDEKAGTYFHGNPAAVTAWDTACGCLVTQKGTDGLQSSSGYTNVHPNSIKWAKVCNLDYRKDPSNALSCPDTVDTAFGSPAAFAYKILDPQSGHTGYSAGLKKEHAKACECLAKQGYDSTNSADKYSYDFRAPAGTTPNVTQDPLSIPGFTPQLVNLNLNTSAWVFGGQKSKNFSVPSIWKTPSGAAEVMGDSDMTGDSCTANFCKLGVSANLSCCVETPTYALPSGVTTTVLPQYSGGTDPSGNPYPDFRGYCSPYCYSAAKVYDGGNQVNEIAKIRQTITGGNLGYCGEHNMGSGGAN